MHNRLQLLLDMIESAQERLRMVFLAVDCYYLALA